MADIKKIIDTVVACSWAVGFAQSIGFEAISIAKAIVSKKYGIDIEDLDEEWFGIADQLEAIKRGYADEIF